MDKGIIFDNIVVDKNPEKAIQGWDAALQWLPSDLVVQRLAWMDHKDP